MDGPLPSRNASCFPGGRLPSSPSPGNCRCVAAGSVHVGWQQPSPSLYVTGAIFNFSCAAFYKI